MRSPRCTAGPRPCSDNSTPRDNRPYINGTCEGFHETLQDECYNLLFSRKKLY